MICFFIDSDLQLTYIISPRGPKFLHQSTMTVFLDIGWSMVVTNVQTPICQSLLHVNSLGPFPKNVVHYHIIQTRGLCVIFHVRFEVESGNFYNSCVLVQGDQGFSVP